VDRPHIDSEPVEPELIYTWPRIALLCGVSVSTARRWAQTEGLPVAWSPGRRVMLDKWLFRKWYMARVRMRRAQLLKPVEPGPEPE